MNQLVKFEVLACKIPVIPVLSLLETNCKTEERQMEYEKTEEHRANPPRQQHMKKQRRPVLVNLQTTTTKKPVETSDTFAHSPKRDQQINKRRKSTFVQNSSCNGLSARFQKESSAATPLRKLEAGPKNH